MINPKPECFGHFGDTSLTQPTIFGGDGFEGYSLHASNWKSRDPKAGVAEDESGTERMSRTGEGFSGLGHDGNTSGLADG